MHLQNTNPWTSLTETFSSGLPEWAIQASSWLSEAPGWAAAILKQTAVAFDITVNEQMMIHELSSEKTWEEGILFKLSSRPERFHLHALPGTYDRLHTWILSKPESQQQKLIEELGKIQTRIPEAAQHTLKAWDAARNLFPVIGNHSGPFLAVTFRFGEAAANQVQDMPDPSSFKLWDMAGNGKLISQMQNGALSFYLCELNLPTLVTAVMQITSVFALSVIKWVSKMTGVLSDLLKGSIEGIKKIPKEVLIGVLGVLSAALLVPAIRNQLGEWLKSSSAWIKSNWEHLMEWFQAWMNSLGAWVEWLNSLGLLGGLLTEVVWTDLSGMVAEIIQKGPETASDTAPAS